MNTIRNRILKAISCSLLVLAPLSASIAHAADPEKSQLKLGFIKLTDMVPLAIAYEKGFFEDEGLFVTLEAQANWKVLLDRVLTGELDGAHMLAGQPIGATIGFGTKADVVTSFSMDLNGKGITVSNAVWEEMKKHVPMGKDGKPVHPIKADALKPVIEKFKSEGKPFNLGMVFPVSTHNYILRYWLAAGGINPGLYAPAKGDITGTLNADALLSVTPPPQMPATMEAGTISGYCVGEPWNQQAVFKGIGVPVIADFDIWKNNPDKVFGTTKAWADANPETNKRLLKALIRAAKWLDESPEHRQEAVQIISRPEYVGADAKVIANSMTGTFEYEKGDKRAAPDFNVFYRYNATYPFYSDAIWYLTQMRRWGQIAEGKPDSWYIDTARKVYQPAAYQAAAAELVKEGKAKADEFPAASHDGFRAPTSDFIDGVTYDGHKPNAYINSFKIGLKADGTL